MIKNEWSTFTHASIRIGKSRSYLHMLRKSNPEYFEEGTYKQEGRIWLISDEGLEIIMKKIKKEGDQLREATLKRSTNQSSELWFYPNFKLYHYFEKRRTVYEK